VKHDAADYFVNFTRDLCLHFPLRDSLEMLIYFVLTFHSILTFSNELDGQVK